MARRVRGRLLVEGEQTGDGRLIGDGVTTWVDPPLPLAWIRDGDQHVGLVEVAPQVGIIETITREGADITFAGQIDDEQPDGAEVVRRLEAGLAPLGERFGLSVDPDDWAVELVDTTGAAADEIVLVASGHGALPAFTAAAGEGDPEGDVLMEDSADSLVERYTRFRIRGATLCAVGAFDNAYLELDPAADGEQAAPADAPPAPDAVAAAASCACQSRGRRASAEGPRPPVRPPAAWFEQPALDGPTPITVIDDGPDYGRVFGHLAGSGCHRSFPDSCMRVADATSRNFRGFNNGPLRTVDGDDVYVGQITLTGGHASVYMTEAEARRHYDDTNSVVADVRTGWDAENDLPWFAGSLRPDVTPEQIRALRAQGVSGDWRRGDGGYDLIALTSVPVEGWPVPVEATVADGRIAAVRLGPVTEPARPGLAASAAADPEVLRRLAVLEANMAVLAPDVEERLAARIHRS